MFTFWQKDQEPTVPYFLMQGNENDAGIIQAVNSGLCLAFGKSNWASANTGLGMMPCNPMHKSFQWRFDSWHLLTNSQTNDWYVGAIEDVEHVYNHYQRCGDSQTCPAENRVVLSVYETDSRYKRDVDGFKNRAPSTSLFHFWPEVVDHYGPTTDCQAIVHDGCSWRRFPVGQHVLPTTYCLATLRS